MSKRISPEVKAQLVALLPVYPSNLKIVDHLKSLGSCVSLSTVERARREGKLKSKGWTKAPRKLPEHVLPNPDKKHDIKKIDQMISSANPPSQRMTAKKLGRSREYVQRIIKENVNASQMEKRKVQALSARQAKQRYDRGMFFKTSVASKIKIHFHYG